VRIYACDINDFPGLEGVELLTDSRVERVHRLKARKDKVRCLVGGLLLRSVCGVTDDGKLRYGAHGKPYLKRDGVFFSLSHSGDYVILAVSGSENGADIEKVKPRAFAAAKRCFTAGELDWLRLNDTDEAFFILWTAKEAVMKAAGMGFSLSPSSFGIPMTTPLQAASLSTAPLSLHAAGRTWFLEWMGLDGHIICAASEREGSWELIAITHGELFAQPPKNAV
jgi:4'-phosphopantetheinyl transferase